MEVVAMVEAAIKALSILRFCSSILSSEQRVERHGMSDSNVKEFKVTGGALAKPRGGRRTGTRKNRQHGGEGVPGMQGEQVIGQVQNALANNFGPSKMQQGGDNSGALLQIAQVPQMGGPMNTQEFASKFQGSVQDALGQFGPDKAQQFGGKKAQAGGDGIAGTVQLAANRAPTMPGAPAPTPVISGVAPSQPAPVGGGVTLLPPKRKTRIALKAKRGGSDSDLIKNNVPPMPGGGHTRKARKIHLRVKGVTARLAKAKKAKKVAASASIADIRHKLESAGVIKKGSKAPENMLRTMYADLLITKKGL